MASPTCEVKDGAGAYLATTNGVDVTPTNTVTIHLVSSAGVNTWSIQCVATDELSTTAAVNASLVIDTVAKTATFTAPAAGRSYLFQSQINSGLSVDGTSQPSYTTTFGVYTIINARRVHSLGETFESNATFGWMSDFNSFVRATVSTPTGTGFYHITAGSADGAAKLVENADVHASAAIALSKLAASGTADNIIKTSGGVPVWGTINLATANAVGTSTLRHENGGLEADVSAYSGLVKISGGATSALTAASGVEGFITGGTLPMANGGLNGNVSAFSGLVKISGGVASAASLGTGVETFLATPSSANLASAVTGETGSGALVFGTSPTISSADLAGSLLLSGAQTTTTNNAKGSAIDKNPVNLQTTDATVSTLDSIVTSSNTVYVVSWVVGAIGNSNAHGAGYMVSACFRNTSGTCTQLGTTLVTVLGEDNSAWACTIDNSGTTIRLRVTGAAGVTIQWTACLTELTVVA